MKNIPSSGAISPQDGGTRWNLCVRGAVSSPEHQPCTADHPSFNHAPPMTN